MWIRYGLLVCAAALLMGSTCLSNIGTVIGDLRDGGHRADGGTGTSGSNSRGIYVAAGGNYCVLHWCPEAFIHPPDGGVLLDARFENTTAGTFRTPVGATFDGQPVTLLGIGAEPTALAIHYRDSSGENWATGADVKRVNLLLTQAQTMSFGEATQSDGLVQYEVRINGKPYCSAALGSPDRSTFFAGKRVDGNTGAVKDAPSTMTLACSSGAIVACLASGVRPWAGGTDDALSACVQEKRTRP